MQDKIKGGFAVNAFLSYEHFYSYKYKKKKKHFPQNKKKKKDHPENLCEPRSLAGFSTCMKTHVQKLSIVDSRVSHGQPWVDIVSLVWGNILHRATIFSISVWAASGEKVQEFRSAMILVPQRTRYEREFTGQSIYYPFHFMPFGSQRWKLPIILMPPYVCVCKHTHTHKQTHTHIQTVAHTYTHTYKPSKFKK